MNITVTNNQKDIRIVKKKTRLFIEKALEELSQPDDVCVNFSFVDEKEITRLNRIYFRKHKTTDVIALGYKRQPRYKAYSNYLGDIIISPDIARQNAKTYNTSFIYELYLYIIHGLLHLLGHDDMSPRAANRMKRLQQEFLEKVCKKLKIMI
jgi:probable rRNA maturation factor